MSEYNVNLLLQNFFLSTDLEHIAVDVHLVEVVMDPAESLHYQQLHR